MDVIFRADGNAQIGLGHLTRCLAMAQMLHSEFEIAFVCKDIPQSICTEIHKLNFKLKKIIDESEFLEMLSANDIVVLDHYGLGSDVQALIKGIGCKLVCIDDIHETTFYADLIVNHAPNILPRDYNAQTYSQFALGLDYVLLRPIFLQKAKEEIGIRSIETVFVCFGGSDSKNLTSDVVDILKLDRRFKQVYIVVGAAYEYLASLKQNIKGDERFKLHFAIGPAEIAQLILDSGLAIVPSSGILQEVLALQCKVISGMYVENQENIFQKFKDLNAFESAETFSKADILHAIELSFAKQGQLIEKFIDGRSGDRIFKYFKQIERSDKVSIRRIEERNLHKTFEWATNSEIRRFFFNKESIDYATHAAWFRKRLKDSMCFYYIGMFEGKEFGSIRFDIKEDIAMVSYLIDSNYQNKGLGTILLNKGLQLFINQSTHDISKVRGEVLIENLASIKVFQKLGYNVSLDDERKLFRFEKIIRY